MFLSVGIISEEETSDSSIPYGLFHYFNSLCFYIYSLSPKLSQVCK